MELRDRGGREPNVPSPACPAIGDLLAAADTRRPDAVDRSLRLHLRQCVACQRQLDDVTGVVEAIRRADPSLRLRRRLRTIAAVALLVLVQSAGSPSAVDRLLSQAIADESHASTPSRFSVRLLPPTGSPTPGCTPWEAVFDDGERYLTRLRALRGGAVVAPFGPTPLRSAAYARWRHQYGWSATSTLHREGRYRIVRTVATIGPVGSADLIFADRRRTPVALRLRGHACEVYIRAIDGAGEPRREPVRSRSLR